MSCVLVGSGWHHRLFTAEMAALIPEAEIEHKTTRIFFSDTNLAKETLLHSAMLDDLLLHGQVVELVEEEVIETLKISFTDWLENTNIDPSHGTVAVRASRHGKRIQGWSPTKLAGHFGGVFSAAGWRIDLENPDLEIALVVDAVNQVVAWGVSQYYQPPRLGWKGRSPTQRPFFKPISLDPRHAKLMLNLLCPTGPVLDPLCGTGGIAVEAGLMGLPSISIDLDIEMVEGAKRNYRWAQQLGATGNGKISHGDATDLVGVLAKLGELEIGAVCLDPPYGRNAWRSQESGSLFLQVCASARAVVESGTRLACMIPSSPDSGGLVYGRQWEEIIALLSQKGWRVLDHWQIPVHASMGRVMVLAIAD
ncbi:MAG: hypothetical protein QF817_00020 [Candidatus Poseidoniaceae archaeon]|nr:hypothetical protein [Candidatus Poseidoniaceae archaeon]